MSLENRQLILITGLGGSGKTTLAEQLAKHMNLKTIRTDDYKFGENWRRKSWQEYFDALMGDIDFEKGRYVVEGIFYSTGDNENQSQRMFHYLLQYSTCVIVIDPDEKVEHAASLIDRSIRRYTGEEPQGTCVESRENRARLLIRCIESYDRNVKQLDEWKTDLRKGSRPYVVIEPYMLKKWDILDLVNVVRVTIASKK